MQNKKGCWWTIEIWHLICHFVPRSSCSGPPVHVYLIAVMCATVGSKCITARCSCVWARGRTRKCITRSFDFGWFVQQGMGILLGHLGWLWLSFKMSVIKRHFETQPNWETLFFTSFPGGCSTRQPALCTPSVAFYLACAAFPTWLPSPVSAGSRSAVQITVREPKTNSLKGFSIFTHVLWQMKRLNLLTWIKMQMCIFFLRSPLNTVFLKREILMQCGQYVKGLNITP